MPALGRVTMRPADRADIPDILALYHSVNIHTGNYRHVFDKESDMAFHKVGGMFNVPTPQELCELVDDHVVLVQHLTLDNGDRDLTGYYSSYMYNLVEELEARTNTPKGPTDGAATRHRQSCDTVVTQLATHNTLIDNILDDTRKEGGRISLALDFIVSPQYRRQNLGSMFELHVFDTLRRAYDTVYLLGDIYDVTNVTANGVDLLDRSGKSITMENLPSKHIQGRKMGGFDLEVDREITINIPYGNDLTTGDMVRETVSVDIRSHLYAFHLQKAIASNRR